MTRRARAVAGGALLLLLGAGGWVALPLPADLLSAGGAHQLRIEDRHGLLLRATRADDGSRRSWVPLAEMDPDLLAAFVAVEDRRFFSHRGVDPRAVARATRTNLLARRFAAGGSTITMQLARLLRPESMPRTLVGKAAQMAWAVRLEAHLSKQEILEQYLNRVPLGQAAAGVDAAAELYFGASARRVSLGQAALLAGLARSPTGDNPLLDPRRARDRRAVALAQVRRFGYASGEDVARARAEPLLRGNPSRPFLAPHFTTRVLARAEAEGAPVSGVWRTSLDRPLQLAVEDEVRHTVDALKERGVAHAAAVVLDNRTGEILAWVGSPDFWADTAGQVDMVVSRRQPGSALKPFLYALAFDRGYSAASVLPDVARTYATGTGVYAPRNYDRRFHGPVRAREALGSSFNVPAVELAHRLGVGGLLAALHRAGFASLDRGAEHYGLGLALGNGEVTLLELANAYRALANGGRWRPARFRAAPPAYSPDRDDPGREVVTAAAAALALDILQDPTARIAGFGLSSPLDLPCPAAVKTGTSRHFTDNWAVGVTGGFTVAVWAGNFSGRPMEGVSGVTGAGPLLHRIMLVAGRRLGAAPLPRPGDHGAVALEVCRLSGARAGASCPVLREWFYPGTEPEEDCRWHVGGAVQLPVAYAEWVAQQDAVASSPSMARALAGERGDSLAGFRILSPREGDRYAVPPGVDSAYATLALRTTLGNGDRVQWFVDGRPLRSDRWRLVPGRHVIRARSRAGDADEVRIEVGG